MLRALRGATTVREDNPDAITDATMELLEALAGANDLRPERIISAIFTATPDLRAEFPAVAARRLGWLDVALLDAVEIDRPGALPFCIRVLLHVEMPSGRKPVHIYLYGAVVLRPDLV